jgi:DNA mismatch repair protein MSH5
VGRGHSCPKVLAATHFHEIFREDILVPEELPITFVHMQTMLTSNSGQILMEGDDGFMDELQDSEEKPIGQGDHITYLYK